MKPQGSHAHEDRLLDFAYDELPPTEARQMELHVQGCARCSEALHGIRGVRTTMSRLPLESAPDAGLESLMAYAQQAARRSAAGPEPAPRWWRRLLAPALGMAAVGVFGVVVVQVNREVDLSPVLSKKEVAQEQRSRGNKDMASPAAPAPAPIAEPTPAKVEQMHAQFDEELRAEQRERPMPTKAAPKPARRAERGDWSNAGAGSPGGFPEKKVALEDEEDLGGFGGLSTKGVSRSKRGVAMDKSLSSPSTAQRAEPAPDWDDAPPAQAQAAAAPGAGAPSEEPQQAAQYAPPGKTLKISGSTSRPASLASAASASDDAPERGQAPAAMPPPPPAAPAYQPPMAAGAIAQAEGVEAQKAKESESPREKASAARSAPSPAELLRQADVASRSGDKAQEVAFLRAALTAGAQGAQRLDALSRLCEAEFELGRRQSAIDICRRLVAEAPGSRAARLAQRRLESELQSPADQAPTQ